MKIRLLLLAVYLGLQTGCAQVSLLPTEPRQQTWRSHLNEMSRLTDWTIRGRISVVTPKESWTASLHWHQADEVYRMKLIAPLGQGTYEVEGNNEVAFIRTAKNEIYKAGSVADLLFGHLDREVRPAALACWVRGIPDPETVANELRLTDDELLSSMEQHGFRISILRYQGIDGTLLPRKIAISNDTIQVKMVIQNWTI